MEMIDFQESNDCYFGQCKSKVQSMDIHIAQYSRLPSTLGHIFMYTMYCIELGDITVIKLCSFASAAMISCRND